jgi:hypothetical protein
MNDESTKEGKNSLVKTNKERQAFIQKKINKEQQNITDRQKKIVLDCQTPKTRTASDP